MTKTLPDFQVFPNKTNYGTLIARRRMTNENKNRLKMSNNFEILRMYRIIF